MPPKKRNSGGSRRQSKSLLEKGVYAQVIEKADVRRTMIGNYIEYGLRTNRHRAIPDVRDGLIDVQRAMLTVMNDLPNDRKTEGNAALVGSAMAKYHPHGDSAIYGALAKLAQGDRYPVPVLGFQGNLGGLDGSEPAQMRYTKGKASPGTLAMIGRSGDEASEIDLGGVPMVPNYNDELMQPEVMPARIPSLLINGNQLPMGYGIKVLDLPRHNPREILDLAEHLLKLGDGNIRTSTLMKLVPGPDMPNMLGNDHGLDIIDGGNGGGIEAYLTTGQGSFVMSSSYHIEEYEIDKKRIGREIHFDSIPFGVSTEQVAEDFEKKLIEPGLLPDSITMHVYTVPVVDIHEYDPNMVLPYLFGHTRLRTSWKVGIRAHQPDGTFGYIGVVEALRFWLDHRRRVIRDTSKGRVERYTREKNRLETLLLVLDHADWLTEVAKNSDDALAKIMERFDLDEEMAKTVLDTSFSRLSPSRRGSLATRVAERTERIAHNRAIFTDPEKMNEELLRQIREMKKTFPQKRICTIQSSSDDLFGVKPKEPLVVEPPKPGYLAVSERHSIRWVLRDTIERNVSGDYFSRLVPSDDTQSLFVLTSFGYVVKLDTASVPRDSINIKRHLVNEGVPLDQGESPIHIFTSGELQGHQIVILTEGGRVKAVDGDLYLGMRPGVKEVTTLDEDKDGLVVGALLHKPGQQIGVLTSTGKFSLFEETSELVRSKGAKAKPSGFVKIAQHNGGEIVWFGHVPEGKEPKIVFRSEDGFGAFPVRGQVDAKTRANAVGTKVGNVKTISWAAPVKPSDGRLHIVSGDYDEPVDVELETLLSEHCARNLGVRDLLRVEGSGEIYVALSLVP